MQEEELARNAMTPSHPVVLAMKGFSRKRVDRIAPAR
jgi:hypothetical protein